METPYLIGGLVGLTLIILVLVAVQATLARRIRSIERQGPTGPRRSGSRVVAAEADTTRPSVTDGTDSDDAAVPEEVAWPPMSAGSPAAADRPDDGRTASDRGRVAVGIPTLVEQLDLLSRQLDLLDGLEKREDRESQLAVLFQIDNLTLRLRRRAESALVLAEVTPARRSPEHLTATAAFRAACAQIEEYARVTVEAQIDPLIHAEHIRPLTHLLAELLDNATRFAPAGTPVTARVDRTPEGIALSVRDTGPGFAGPALAAAREALAGRVRSSGGPTGLLVAGTLARPLGCSISLDSAPTGTTVVVTVPSRLFVEDPAAQPRHVVPGQLPGGDGPVPPAGPHPTPSAEPVAAPQQPVLEPVYAGSGAFGDPPAEATTLGSAPAYAGPPVADPRPIEATGAPTFGSVPGTEAFSSAPVFPPVTAPEPVAPAPAPPTTAFEPAAPGFEPVTPVFDPVTAASAPSGLPAPGLPAPAVAAPAFPPVAPHQPVTGAPQAFDPVPSPARSPEDGWIVPAGAGTSATASASVRDEVLAELSRLSGYAPTPTEGTGGADLLSRTPGAAPELQPVNVGPQDRDAEVVRSRLSSFRSGVGRGRRSRS